MMPEQLRFSVIVLIFSCLMTACSANASPTATTPPPETPTVPMPQEATTPPELTATLELTPTAPPIQAAKDIVYASVLDAEASTLEADIYYSSDSAGPQPVVVFLPGYNTDKSVFQTVSEIIAERGAVVFIVNWPTPSSDLAWKDDGKNFRLMAESHLCAVQFARARAADYGGDPERVVLLAHSMGARIGVTAALAGDELPVIWEEFAAGRNGPAEQVECMENGVSANVDAFVGIGSRYESVNYLKTRDFELWDIVSPFAHIGRNTSPRIRLILGENDTISLENQTNFNQLLLDAGYDSQLIVWQGGHTVPRDLTADVILEAIGE